MGAFNQHIGRREADALRAQRIDGEKADVGLAALDRLDRLGGSVEAQEDDADAAVLSERPR